MAFPDGKLASHSFVGLAPIAFADNAADPRHAFNLHDAGQYVQPEGDQPVYQGWWNVRTTADYDEPVLEGETPGGGVCQVDGDVRPGQPHRGGRIYKRAGLRSLGIGSWRQGEGRGGVRGRLRRGVRRPRQVAD